MRLLTHDPNGKLVLQTFDHNSPVPRYAILSHTWLDINSHEVTLNDLQTGQAEGKPGYDKIRFCERQAAADGLRYFWIDTCCIDTSNRAEASLAIRSMFNWYRNATRCYVYLQDVSSPSAKAKMHGGAVSDTSSFSQSRWFSRGWTLQELLAPSIVEFFSRDGYKLGDKSTLQEQIHQATAIPHAALAGTPLSDYSVQERFRWREHRETTHKEDGAYSLQGIFGVDLAPIYGEGEAAAFQRLNQEIEKSGNCIRDMYSTDPSKEKDRIESTKGGLLKDSYRWVLNNTTFQQWRKNVHDPLLWIKGDPGKGKTMLLYGIIDELRQSTARATIAYFFFQATDSRINHAPAALRGLLYMLVGQQPWLISHIRGRYDRAGKAIFEDTNAWIVLAEIFTNILQDSALEQTYLVLNALDECVTDQDKLLTFLTEQLATSSKVNWIVSSRN